jgi:hypothetical protein
MNYLVKFKPNTDIVFKGKYYYKTEEYEITIAQGEAKLLKEYCEIVSVSPCESNGTQKKVKNNVTNNKQ